MLKILNRICEGGGREGDIELLEEIGETVRDFSLCALDRTAPNPVLSTIKYFREVKNRVEGCPLDPILFLVTARTRVVRSPGSAIVS